MKMKKLHLTIALLTVTGLTQAVEPTSPYDNESNNGQIDMSQIPDDFQPSSTQRAHAKTIYESVRRLKGAGSVALTEDFVGMLQNDFTLAAVPQKQKEQLEEQHMAFVQIGCPYFGREELKKLMGNDKDFTDKLEEYDAQFYAINKNISTFVTDLNNVTMSQNKTYIRTMESASEKVITAVPAADKLLKDLQDDFYSKFPEFQNYMQAIQDAVRENVQWSLAFMMALDPAIFVTSEQVEQLKTTTTERHTSPKVVAVKRRQAAAKKAL